MYGRTAQGTPFRLPRNDPILQAPSGMKVLAAPPRWGPLFVSLQGSPGWGQRLISAGGGFDTRRLHQVTSWQHAGEWPVPILRRIVRSALLRLVLDPTGRLASVRSDEQD